MGHSRATLQCVRIDASTHVIDAFLTVWNVHVAIFIRRDLASCIDWHRMHHGHRNGAKTFPTTPGHLHTCQWSAQRHILSAEAINPSFDLLGLIGARFNLLQPRYSFDAGRRTTVTVRG